MLDNTDGKYSSAKTMNFSIHSFTFIINDVNSHNMNLSDLSFRLAAATSIDFGDYAVIVVNNSDQRINNLYWDLFLITIHKAFSFHRLKYNQFVHLR